MKKNIIIISLFIILATSFYFVFIQYKKAYKIDSNAYIFTSNKVIEQLFVNDLTDKDSKIDYIKVNENEQVFKRGDKYYIGDSKKEEIMNNYPIISVDGSRVSNMNDKMMLINDNFKITKSYNNAILANGILYNSTSYDRVDNENYFLLNIQDKVFLNSTKIKIKEKEIPINSIVYFMENEVRYYYLENNIFKYDRIQGINKDDILYFFDKQIKYEDLLYNLEVIIKENNEVIDEVIPDDIKPPENSNDKNNTPEYSEEEYVYIKPDATVDIKSLNVYSFKLNLNINDQARRIETSPTFEIKYDGKTFLRKTLYNSGEFEIDGLLPDTEFQLTGYFTYRNESDKLLKKTIIDEVLKTNDISKLEPIKLTYSNDSLYSNKIEFNEVDINNKKSDEVLKGIKNVDIKLNDDIYSVPGASVSKLKKLQTINYTTPTTLKSNTIYDTEFVFYDIAGNILNVENNKTLTKTIKEKPSANITITSTDLTLFTSIIEIINADNVSLDNLFYVVTDNHNNIIKKDTLDNLDITVKDLDINTIYNLSVYADYDLEDGNGIQKNVLLKSVKVSTKPISTLGFVRFNLQEKNITQHDANYSLTINNSSTDKKLLELLSNVIITIKEKDTEEVIKNVVIDGDELNNLKDTIPFDLNISDLYSNTEYTLDFTTEIKQGTKKYSINGLSNLKGFRTLKKPANVEVINKFTNQNLIDFDVKITDVDHSIESDRVLLYVRNSSGTLISYKNLKINDDYVQLTFDKLDKEEDYTFTYSVEEYNEGYTNATYEQDKILLESVIRTSVGIYGSIDLDSLLKEITSSNLFDIKNNKRWKKDGSSSINSKNVDIENNIIKLSAKNGYATYSYYLPEGKDKVITLSFYARHTVDSNMQSVYLSNGGGSNKQNKIDSLTTDFKKYTMTLSLYSNNYVGFYIDEITSNNTTTTIEIQNLQIKLANDTTSSNISNSYHSSGLIFSSAIMYSGNDLMPNYNGLDKITGNSGNGFARITDMNNNQIYDYSYTGKEQSFIVPSNGSYKFEAWGAQGGTYSSYIGGKGAYTSGILNLKKDKKIYVYVGGMGGSNYTVTNVGGYNGGGYSGDNSGARSFGGGGATDFRTENGVWNNLESLKSRIMVAAGGGGAVTGSTTKGGAAGGLVGSEGTSSNSTYQSSTYLADGGNQFYAGNSYMSTRSGGFGYALQSISSGWGGGGGSGYYGGATGHGRTGAGGSSYISGYKGCVSITSLDSNDYIDYSEKETYLATLYASIYDSKNELEKKEFYIQIVRDGTLENNFQYDMQAHTQTEKLLLAYHLKKNSSYEIRLSVKIRDRYYTINSLLFTTDEEIRTIKNIDDFFSIHTTGKYLVSEDLDFRNSGKNIGFWFSGKIDFQGHKVLIDTDGAPSSLIANVATDALITNLDVHFYLNNSAPKSNYYGLYYDYRGRTKNLKITVEESTNVANVNFCLIAYVNRGTIENFVINNKAGLSGQRWTSLGMMHNYGTLKNGYAYGANINASFPTTYPSESKRVGAFAGYAGENSRIENVYSLIGIDTVNINNTENYDIDNRVGSLVGEHYRGIIRNGYTYTSGDNRVLTRDANIGNYSNVTHSNLYYISNSIYNPLFSLKVAKLALKDIDFQNIINEDNMFNINDFVTYGYFPHIKWPDNMPNQEYINLPTIDDADLIDITNIKETKVEGKTTLATLMLNNPNNEMVTNVGIKDIGTIDIVSQETKDNKTTLVIRLSNPLKYISKYYVKSITAKSSFGKEYTRDYKDNERVLLVDMYREINNEQEWLNIKTYPTENFILNNDLDFENMPYTKFQINNVQGKLNGNRHTIKNIEVTSGAGLINELRGTLKDIYIENVKRTKDNQYDRNGIVGYAYTSSVIDNVHVKNISLYSYNRMGGIVGYGDGTVIKNSSVSNVSNIDLSGQVDVKVGGIIGEGHNLSIQNCYVKDMKFDVTTAKVVYASGGIAGYLGSGSVSNVYALGSIETNSQETGGIVGRSGAYVSNSYSNVDIISRSDYIGGIIGNATNTNIANCLSVGSLYSYLQTQYIKRIAGNISISNNNYAWNNQHINGKIQATSDGEELLTKEELNDSLSYIERINLGSDFNYDDLENGKLPKLYNTDRTNLLPNQSDSYLKNYKFEVTSINTYKTISNVTVLLTINNPENYPIKDIIVDNMSGEIKKNVTLNGISTIEVLLTPERAFDSYRLSKIIYNNGIEDITYNTDVKIDAQFYKDLEKYEDWQKISDTYAENYRLVADIDFKDKDNVNYNVLINRLEGTGDTKKVLKNITINVTGNDQSLIKSINSHINNIEFNNITMNSTSTSNISRNGLILYAFGLFENTDFNNITLNLGKSNYVGVLSYDRTSDLRNINLDHITVKGRDYTSGFIAKSIDKAITNVNISNSNINGVGSYVAGLIANGDYYWTTSVFHLSGTNVTVVGTGNYIGGIFGYGGGNYVDVINANVTGSGSYVGGVAGQYHSGEGRYVNISDSIIHGGGNNIGGLAGFSYNLAYCYVDNTEVYGDKETSLYVGGMTGYGGHTIWYSGVSNSKIESKGSYVGGLKGMLSYSTVHSNYVVDTSVTGSNYVGGIVGGHNSVSNTIARCMTNAVVTATNVGAGGILGYAVNQNTDEASNKIYIYNNIVNSTVNATNVAGGLVGRMDKLPFSGHMYSNIISANVNTTADNSSPGIVIGTSDYYTMNIPNTKVYIKSKLNDQVINNIGGLDNNNYIDYNWLKVQKNYTDIGFSTTYFNFSKLTLDYFPYLSNQVSTRLVYFPLPEESTSGLYELLKMEYESLHLLPEFKIYPSDINAFNIEFDNIDLLTKIKVNNDESEITNRVFTYNYDFNSDINITLSDGINSEQFKFSSDDLKNKVYTKENNYYFIKDNKLVSNNNVTNEKILNIYDDKALLENGKIIDLTDSKEKNTIDNNFYRRTTIKPLYSFDYNDNKIKTFYNYSTINEKIINNQIFINNGNFNMITGGNNIFKQSIIIDKYNNNDYLTILNKNKIIYNLKDKITFPNNFNNSKIIAMSNNLNNNSNIIGLIYENGNLLAFDYRNGFILYNDFKNSENIIDYYKAKFLSKNILPNNNIIKSYSDSKKLINKLQKTSLDEIISNTNNNDAKNYISVYNDIKKSYDVYDITLINNDKINVDLLKESVNDQINANASLDNYYNNPDKKFYKNIMNSVSIFIIFLLMFIYLSIILGSNIKKAINQ